MDFSDLVRFGVGVVWLQKTGDLRLPLGLASSDFEKWCGLLEYKFHFIGRSDIA